jgi:rsbT co-antagonist protein RsbR
MKRPAPSTSVTQSAAASRVLAQTGDEMSADAELSRLLQVLQEHEEDLLSRWTEAVSRPLRGRAVQLEVRRELTEIWNALRTGVATGTTDAQSPAFDELRSLLAELSRTRARQGFSPRETAIGVLALKDSAQTVLDPTGDGSGLAERYREFLALGRLVDELEMFTFETFAEARERVIADQAEQLLELATPVVKLWEGIVALPLVGTLDSARTQVVMESLLQTLVDTGSAHAIIDITGVPAVDTQVAQHLLKTVVAARLMGAECIVSGIRPQIAQTMVALGIEFGDIATKSTLADALALALSQTGTDIVRRVPRRRPRDS